MVMLPNKKLYDMWVEFCKTVIRDIVHDNNTALEMRYPDPFSFADIVSFQEVIYNFIDVMNVELNDNKTLHVVKRNIRTIGIEGCDFSGKTTLTNKLATLGYHVIKQPSVLTRDIINILAELKNDDKVSEDNKRTVNFLIAFTFEIDRIYLLCNLYEKVMEDKIGSNIVISDRTSMSNFLVNQELVNLCNITLDDKVAYAIGLKKHDTHEKLYKKLLKLNFRIADYFNHSICWLSNFDKYTFTDVYDKIESVRNSVREEACPHLDKMEDRETYISRVISQENVADALIDKYNKHFNIEKMNSSYFMDEDECLMKVIKKIKEFL